MFTQQRSVQVEETSLHDSTRFRLIHTRERLPLLLVLGLHDLTAQGGH